MADAVETGRDSRIRRALLAQLRQELGSPAAAILDYTEMLLEDAAAGERARFMADLRRIETAGRTLSRLVLSLLERDGAQAATAVDLDEFRRALRHDLRTPINAIKGYGEMLADDARDAGLEAMAHDLDKLLDAAQQLLERIDALVAFSGRPAGSAPATASAGLVEGVLDAVRPVTASEAEAMTAAPSRVLVVDDNAMNRDVLSRRLTRQGHHVQQAESGEAALARVAQGGCDLILLDLMMPGISGYDVLLRLKRDPRTRDIPVVMISALDEIDSTVRCIEAGAEDYLTKPFNPVLLRARIGASLEKKRLRDRERQILEAIRLEKEKSEHLLLNILPRAIVDRLQNGETVIADRHANVSILFADLVGFTRLSTRLHAHDLVRLLNGLFSEFDRLALELGVEKIKTVGDAYMVASGLPQPRADHAHAVAEMGLRILEAVDRRNRELPEPIHVRVGIHSGMVVAGVIGTHKFIYDIWGDAVNTASRMESQGTPDRIQVSGVTWRQIRDRFELEPHGVVEIRGKGPMETYILRGRR